MGVEGCRRAAGPADHGDGTDMRLSAGYPNFEGMIRSEKRAKSKASPGNCCQLPGKVFEKIGSGGCGRLIDCGRSGSVLLDGFDRCQRRRLGLVAFRAEHEFTVGRTEPETKLPCLVLIDFKLVYSSSFHGYAIKISGLQRFSPRTLQMAAPMAPPAIGASQNSQSCCKAHPPTKSACPVERAGLTEVLVTGMEIR